MEVRKQHRVCFPVTSTKPVLFDNKVKSPSRFLKNKDEVLLDKLSKQVKTLKKQSPKHVNSDLKLLTGFGHQVTNPSKMTIQENVYTDDDGNIVCIESDIDSQQTPLQQTMMI